MEGRSRSEPSGQAAFPMRENTGDRLRRINVVLDDELVTTALKVSGFRTQKEAFEEGLKLLNDVHRQKRTRAFRGKLK